MVEDPQNLLNVPDYFDYTSKIYHHERCFLNHLALAYCIKSDEKLQIETQFFTVYSSAVELPAL